MARATIDRETLRTAVDSALWAWAAVEIALRLLNRNAERGADWTFAVVVGAVVAGVDLGFRAAHVSAYSIGDPRIAGAVGLGLVLGGAGLRVWSILTLGRLFTFVVSIQGDHELVDHGPYRVLRHPSYTGGLVGLLGVGVARDNWLSVGALLLVPLAGVLIRIPFEEAALRAGLGASYDEYVRRTRRLVPRVW
ncbi:MAG: isoprenylcysteine carboxylmethyltransferase family protein [Acidobacteriota bacterium]|nr:isoprenylcysteine carboxylmethyltransferase family protein [Acidobacteriota bacterium]